MESSDEPSHHLVPKIDDGIEVLTDDQLAAARVSLIHRLGGKSAHKYVRFVLAALGSIPWVESLLGAAAALQSELEQGEVNDLNKLWLQEHEAKFGALVGTITEILTRLDGFGDEIRERMESDEYLGLIRKGFRSWDEADTQEKRNLIKNLLTNAGGTKLCTDDLVRLFISWIDFYHESHFAVIREIFRNPGATRGQIWDAIRGTRPRENSSEADLFRLLVRDLSTGGVIRQGRPTNAAGQFIKKQPQRTGRPASGVMKSAFDDEEEYVLTELGREFVHYTMNEVVGRLE